MGNSKIEWTQATWNPVRGCSMAEGSQTGGCLNCYAARQAARALPSMRFSDGSVLAVMRDSGPRWTGRVELQEHMLDIPLRRKTPTTYFVNSMSDLFHEDLPDEAIDRIFGVMALCPQHTFQCLTKRVERMQRWATKDRKRAAIAECLGELYVGNPEISGICPLTKERALALEWPLPNVWLGVSCEDQATADARIPLLLQTPAVVRFVSAEPLLGPITFKRFFGPQRMFPAYGRGDSPSIEWGLDRNGWVIVGGESGPGARPMDMQWARNIIAQCREAKVPVFVKQLGARPCYEWTGQGHDRIWKPGTLGDFDASVPNRWNGRLRDRKGGTMEEWPVDLRVREMPVLTSRTASVDAFVNDGLAVRRTLKELEGG